LIGWMGLGKLELRGGVCMSMPLAGWAVLAIDATE
jgi:hypothetical protein